MINMKNICLLFILEKIGLHIIEEGRIKYWAINLKLFNVNEQFNKSNKIIIH